MPLDADDRLRLDYDRTDQNLLSLAITRTTRTAWLSKNSLR